MSTTFTPDQATKMLPLVKSITKDVQAYWDKLVVLRTEIESAFKKNNIEAPSFLRDELNHLVDKTNAYIQEVESLGLYVAEFKRGIINFPSIRDGRKVLLSWKMDEDVVEFWHELDETIDSRRHVSYQLSMK
jgi:hypothetical protein